MKVDDVLTLSAPTDRGVNNTTDVRVAVIARNVGLLSAFSAFIQADTLAAALRAERPDHRRHPPLPQATRPGPTRWRRGCRATLAKAGLAGDGSRGRSPTG